MARGHTDLGVVPKECRPSRSSLLSGVGRARAARGCSKPCQLSAPPKRRDARAALPHVFMGHFSRRLRSGRECAGVTTSFMGREQLAQDG